MGPPRISPTGVVEYPEGYRVGARSFAPGLRLLAGLVLVAFLAVGVATTVGSLGRYCLTRDAGKPVQPFR